MIKRTAWNVKEALEDHFYCDDDDSKNIIKITPYFRRHRMNTRRKQFTCCTRKNCRVLVNKKYTINCSARLVIPMP